MVTILFTYDYAYISKASAFTFSLLYNVPLVERIFKYLSTGILYVTIFIRIIFIRHLIYTNVPEGRNPFKNLGKLNQ